MQRTNSDAVNRRFFIAIDALVTYKLVSSLSGFCVLHGLSPSRYREMRRQFGLTPKEGYTARYRNMEIEALSILVANYPISALWLLTGRGNMLTKKI